MSKVSPYGQHYICDTRLSPDAGPAAKLCQTGVQLELLLGVDVVDEQESDGVESI